MKRQGGFTLIELVVVIVILGILAVTAAPRFLNLQGDARTASLQGLQGAMKGASGIVFGKSAIAGVESSTSGSVGVDGDTVDVVFGYPAATTTGIGNAVSGINDDWAVVSGSGATGPGQTISYTFSSGTYTNCQVNYTSATSEAEPAIEVDSDGC